MTRGQIAMLLGGLVIVVPVAQLIAKSLAENHNERLSPVAKAESNVVAVISRQDAEGVTENDFSPEFLANLGGWIEERTSAYATRRWDEAGIPPDQRAISHEGVYVEAGTHKLAVIRIRMGDTTPSAIVAGIVGDEVVRVACVDQGGGDVVITSGPCDEKIREAFGVSINPMNNNG